uniref:Uncharacterized protein n=1 Tax=Anguilla anguilla TaxID=7936 RepID=A0A0E9Q5M1_ANGAN
MLRNKASFWIYILDYILDLRNVLCA